VPPNRFESEVESFLEGSHGDRTHIKRADHHTVTPLCGTLLTAIAFAGEKWAFFVRFSVAEVSPVSTLVVQGRALVMVVSRWPASVAAEVSLVASSPRGCVLCAKKFALRGLMVGASAKKFALQAQNGRKTLFSGALGEFFRG